MFGYTVSGAIWTQVLPGELNARLDNQTLATEVYGAPLTTALRYPIGSPERDGIIAAYRHTQRLLCITGICLCVLLLAFALLLRNPRLGDEQSLPQAETDRGVDAVDTDGHTEADLPHVDPVEDVDSERNVKAGHMLG